MDDFGSTRPSADPDAQVGAAVVKLGIVDVDLAAALSSPGVKIVSHSRAPSARSSVS